MNPGARWPVAARAAASAVLGAVGALGLEPYGFWPATVAMLLGVPALMLTAASPRQAALIGWALGAGWFAHALFWITEPFFVDAARHGWMAPFAIALMAAGGGAFWSAGFWAAHRSGRGDLARIGFLIVTWSLVEFARAYVFTGFPWGALAQIWAGSDVALFLAWIGPQGLAVATLATFLPVGLTLARPAGATAGLVAMMPTVVFGALTLLLIQMRPPVAPLSEADVRLVQPNAPQHQKWDPAYAPVFFNRMIEYTAAGPRPDLIVWPESAVPVLLENAQPALDRVAAAAGGARVILGIQRTDGDRYYNSMISLDASGAVAGTYDKHHLVPFGEYVPLGDLAARIGIRGFAAQQGDGYSAGPGPHLLPLGSLGNALPLICYEAVFPQDASGTPARADFLLQITNDAWFGKRSGPYQHLAQAQMRAIEQGLPMIRVANTGVSAMIDPWGRITAALPLGQAGFVDASLPLPGSPTLYGRIGDAPVLYLLLIATLGIWWKQSRRGNPNNN